MSFEGQPSPLTSGSPFCTVEETWHGTCRGILRPSGVPGIINPLRVITRRSLKIFYISNCFLAFLLFMPFQETVPNYAPIPLQRWTTQLLWDPDCRGIRSWCAGRANHRGLIEPCKDFLRRPLERTRSWLRLRGDLISLFQSNSSN